MNRTKTVQVRCQPCHYYEVMKAALKERGKLEMEGSEISYTEMVQVASNALLKYIKFFNEFPDFQLSNNLKTIAKENPTIRGMKVKQIERLIIERGI